MAPATLSAKTHSANCPVSGGQVTVQAIGRAYRVPKRSIAPLFADIAALDGQTSFTHENCSVFILALLTGEEGEEIKLQHMIFPPSSLYRRTLKKVVFEDCYFANTSLEGTTIMDCQFIRCQFAQCEVYDSTSVKDTTLSATSVDALFVASRGMTVHSPDAIKAQLLRSGFNYSEAAQVQLPFEPTTLKEKEEAVVHIERLLRLFVRSTRISDNLIAVKLGGRAHAFTADYLPELIRQGIFVEISHRGAGQQRHFKLGRPLDVLNRALEKSEGSFERFLAAAFTQES